MLAYGVLFAFCAELELVVIGPRNSGHRLTAAMEQNANVRGLL
jgi:hypothetical protein